MTSVKFPLAVWSRSAHDKTNKLTCAASEDSAQSRHLPSLISLRYQHKKALDPWLPIKHIAMTLIRLGGCPGWSESWQGEQVILFCHAAAHWTFKASSNFGIFLPSFTGVSKSIKDDENFTSYCFILNFLKLTDFRQETMHKQLLTQQICVYHVHRFKKWEGKTIVIKLTSENTFSRIIYR